MTTEVDDGVTQLWQTGGNSLRISANEFRCYSQFVATNNNTILFKVNAEGRIIRDGVDITDNDAALAACLIEFLKIFHEVQIKRDT